ncbi:MAG TPA: cation acetate symporter [Solirubrobacteraceae bacterium]
MIAIAAIAAVTTATLGLGIYGVRLARTTSDLFVASRAITPWWNAAAISGEYLSAASFLGIAGLQMKVGSGALWLPLGFTAGYLALLLFVAAPLRRFGAYTISDFAEARLRSPRIRVLAAVVVLGIAGFYLVPQLKGAGLTLGEVTGAPYWVGVVAVGAVVALNVASGGMRGITYVQAFQYWTKTFAIALPACLLLIHLGGLPERAAMFGHELPHAPAAGLTVELEAPQQVTFPEATAYTVDGRSAEAAAGEEVVLPAGTVELPPGAVVPVAEGIDAQRGDEWARPVTSSGDSSPVFVYSLLLATFLGTMGLPHILVRFYTNPDGPAARRTTVRVLGLLALFYAFPIVYGALGRVLVPELYMTGETDSVVLALPEAAWPGTGGEILGALVAAGAFAAFMSTASGLMVSVAGTISFDLWRRGHADVTARRRRFRIAALGGMLAPVALALVARGLDISVLVGWAFALAASTFCPLFLLGIWWRGLTARGAIAGMAAGGLIASGGIAATLVADPAPTTLSALLAQPAVASVPVAFLTMVGVSLRDPERPVATEETMLALHGPEGLGLEALRTRA